MAQNLRDIWAAGSAPTSARVDASFEGAALEMAAIDGVAAGTVFGESAPSQVGRALAPSLVAGLSAWHRAPRTLTALTMDLGLCAAVAIGATGSVRAGAVGTAALFVVGMMFGVWKRRTSIQAQGVVWFLRPFIPAVFVASLAVWAVTTTRLAVLNFVTVSAAMLILRFLLWVVIGWVRRRGGDLRRSLVVGPAHRIPHIEHRMGVFPEAGLAFAAAYVPEPGDGLTAESAHGLVNRLLNVHEIDHVVFVADEINERVFKDFLRFGGGRAEFSIVMPLAPATANEARAHIGDLGLIPLQFRPSWGSSAAKRVFDVIASAALLLLLSPLLLATAIAIRLDTPGRSLFSQRRVGRDGRMFTIYKFRSMVDGAEDLKEEYLEDNVNAQLLFKLNHDPRVTRIGRLIRRFSIDELPQLLNVVKGDMSLVGPRPLPVDPDDFDPAAQIRHWVLPGITGLWQIHGANALSYEDMVELDLSYIATRSMAVDLQILLRTLPALLVRRSAAY